MFCLRQQITCRFGNVDLFSAALLFPSAAMPPRYRKILPKILSAKAEADVPFVRKIAISETAVTPQGYSKAAIYGCQGALLKRNSFKAPFICTNARPLENPLYMLYNTTEFKAHCMCLEFNSNTEEQKMFCPNCGNHILDANASFCPNCGARLNSFTQGNDQSSAQQDFQQDSQQDFQQDSQQNSQQNFQQDSQQNSQQDSQQSWYNQFNYTPPQQDCTPCAPSANYNGLSIAGFSLSCAAIIFNFLFGLPGIVGLILSIVGLCQCNKRSEKGRGLAIAGIVIGAVLTLLMIFVYAGLILAFDNPWNSGPRYY